jgi:hypothetical protein
VYFAIKAPNAIPSTSTMADLPTNALLPFLAHIKKYRPYLSLHVQERYKKHRPYRYNPFFRSQFSGISKEISSEISRISLPIFSKKV